MSASVHLDLSEDDRSVVLAILRECLPANAAVWVFGSRTTGRARPFSDLDLAIDAGRPLTLDETAQLRDAFTESDLPYRVDITDWRAIGDAFRDVISATRVRLGND